MHEDIFIENVMELIWYCNCCLTLDQAKMNYNSEPREHNASFTILPVWTIGISIVSAFTVKIVRIL